VGGPWEQAARHQAVVYDLNGDGHLDVPEFAGTPSGQAAPGVMLRLMDADGDDQISRDECFARAPLSERPRLAAEFLRRDGNADGLLTLPEWIAANEPSVPDPYVDLVRERVRALRELFQGADADGDGRMSRQEWPASHVSELAPELRGARFDVWDSDGDGAVPVGEVEALLEIAWGLRSREGLLLRKQTGHVVNRSLFYDPEVDRDGDGRLTRAEFRSETRSDELFSEVDGDGDGLIMFAEFAASPRFAIDIIQEFVKLDANFDGKLSPAELTANLPRWQAHLAKYLVPAFDDGDGALDFVEYRRTPPANPLLRWHRRPEDGDHNGALRLEEFHAQPMPALAGLRYEFFRRFDRDGDGSLSPQEYEFRIDYGKLQGDLAFKLKDRDGDGFLIFEDVFDEPRPRDDEPQRLQQYQVQLLRAEESFLAGDADKNGRLSLAEFRDSWAHTTAESAEGLPPIAQSAGGLNWRLAAFLVLDGFVLLGVGVWLIRRSRIR
jgi:Ca2+-binding EF-hand superfamily protein